jgi:D-alanine-D-alanine ligase
LSTPNKKATELSSGGLFDPLKVLASYGFPSFGKPPDTPRGLIVAVSESAIATVHFALAQNVTAGAFQPRTRAASRKRFPCDLCSCFMPERFLPLGSEYLFTAARQMQARRFYSRGVSAPANYGIVIIKAAGLTMGKIHVAIIFGGRSGEHEISLRSARSVADAIDRDTYDVTLIGIDRTGHWHRLDEGAFRELTNARLAAVSSAGGEVMLLPTPAKGQLLSRERSAVIARLDVVFPVLHGPCGEDGTIQGFLELADIAYVGAGVLGSALGMDKDVQKRLLQAAGIPVAPFLAATRTQWITDSAAITRRVCDLGLPLFVKPANLGSSVGITKVKGLATLPEAVRAAFEYDTKVVIEKGIAAREIECAVLGNDDPQASVPGEICPNAEFYSYEAKYIDENGAALLIPAPLSGAETQAVRELAVRVFTLLDCAGMARVDFFLERGSDKVFVNEINTIPGFTSISMYPKLWEASGVPYRQLISRLIGLALERHALRRQLKKTPDVERR